MKGRLKKGIQFVRNNAFFCLVIMIYGLLISSFLLEQGIMCNDEVQHRFKSFYGIREFFKTFVSEQLFSKGRGLAALPTTLFLYAGFASTNRIYERVMAVIAIGLCVLLAACFIKKLFQDKFLTVLYGILLMSFIPVSFEHCAPNAFVTVYCFPFSILLLSLMIYLDYLRTGLVKKCILSGVLFFIPLVSYEIFITYTPMFLLLAFYESRETKLGARIVDSVKKFFAPLSCAIVFLLLYVVMRQLFGSTYDGNQIGHFTLAGMLQIIKQLSLSGMPGYFLFNGKYQYLYQMQAEHKDTGLYRTMLANATMPIVLLVLLFVILIIQLGKKAAKQRQSVAGKLCIVLGACLFISLPTLPLSVSSMYQGNVNENNFVQLPVSFFSYFASCFAIAYFIAIIKSKRSLVSQILFYGLMVVCVFYLFGVQSMNQVFAKEQNRNYNRMVKIEQLLDTQMFHLFEEVSVYSEDIYKTANLLAFNEGFWDNFAQKNQMRASVTQEREQSDYQLYYTDDAYFQLIREENVIVFVPREDMRSRIYLQCGENYKSVELDGAAMYADAEYKVYYFKQNQDGATQVNPGGMVLEY